MSVPVGREVVLSSGAIFDFQVVSGQRCVVLKITDPAQVIVVDAATTAIPVTMVDVAKIKAKTTSTLDIYNDIIVS